MSTTTLTDGATPTRNAQLQLFLVERNIPGASSLTADELRDISCASNEVVAGLGAPYVWHQSYVAGDKIYCLHSAESADVVREHAQRGGFPADVVVPVAATIGPSTARRS